MDLIATLEQEEITRLNKTIPSFAPGDTVKLPVQFTPKSPGDKSETISVRLKGTTNLIASVGIEGNATVKTMMMMESGCSATPGATSSEPVDITNTRSLGRVLTRSNPNAATNPSAAGVSTAS